MRNVSVRMEQLESRCLMSISVIPTTNIHWFTAAASTAECGEPSSAYLQTPGNDVGRSGGCAATDGPAADGKAFDHGKVASRLNALTTPGNQANMPGPM